MELQLNSSVQVFWLGMWVTPYTLILLMTDLTLKCLGAF